MGMTRLQITTEICDTVGKNLGASSLSGLELKERVEKYYLNWAQRRIADHYSFYELQKLKDDATTVANVNTYPIESGANNLGLTDCAMVNSVRLVDGAYSRKLDFWHYRKYDQWYPNPEQFTPDRPRIYTRWGNDLIFFKIPREAFTLKIRYGRYPTELTSDGQFHDYGQDKDMLMVTVGVMQTYLSLQEYRDATIWYEIFLGQVQDAVRSERDDDWEPQAEPTGRPAYMPGEPWIDPFGSAGDPLYRY